MKANLSIKPISSFFLLMLIFPTAFQVYRGGFLILLFISSLLLIKPKTNNISKSVAVLFLINLISSFLFFLIGVFNNGPGAFRTTTVYIFWPFLYFYFIAFGVSFKLIENTKNIILIGGLISSLLILLFICNTIYPISSIITILGDFLDFKSNFLYDGFSQVQSTNLTTVFYTLIFSMSILMMPKHFRLNINNPLLLTTFILSLIIIIISGRRAFWLVLLLTPFITLLLFYIIGISFNYKFLFITLIILFLTITIYTFYNFNFDVLKSQFETLFDFNDPNAGVGGSNYTRKLQYDELIFAWKQSPLFGKGFGTVAGSIIRDDNQTWAYELTYLALLFHTGILGIVIYTSSILWIIINSIFIMKRNIDSIIILFPLIVGLISFLLINSSNPYLDKFDFLWVIFLPVIVINYYKVTNKNAK